MKKTSQISAWSRQLGLLLPLVVASSAAGEPAPGKDSSVLPPMPAPIGAPPAAPAGAPRGAMPSEKPRLRLRNVRIGAEPYAWLAPGRVVKSFITNDPKHLEIAATAQLTGEPAAGIEWEVTPPEGFRLPDDTKLSGPELHLVLERADGNPSGAGEPLSLTLSAMAGKEAKDGLHDTVTVTQDPRDRLRQEYVDLQRSVVPARRELLDEEQFGKLYGKKYPSVTFAELNFSKVPGQEERYPVILATETLVATLEKLRHDYPPALVLSSGFRNPTRQAEVHGAVAESHHQYGRAADLYVAPDSALPKTGRTIAIPADWLRLAAASLRAGGVWIEPMLDCHVNTGECHVHVDVRESGAQSHIVEVSGTVTAPDGTPVPGATVTLAGMEVTTNLLGAYRLKHVLTPHDYPLEASLPGQPPVTQIVAVGDEGAVAPLRLPVRPAVQLTSHQLLSEPAPLVSSETPTAPNTTASPVSTPPPAPGRPEPARPELAIAVLGVLLGLAAGFATGGRPRPPGSATSP